MVNSGDLIQLAYTNDLTAAGIAYVSQQFSRSAVRFVKFNQNTIRQLVVDKAVELAFRRFLDEQEVPYATAPGTAFGKHASYHLILGGWRCNIQSCWIDEPEVVRQVQAQPECLLDAAAILSSERVISWIPGEKDLYIFAFVLGQKHSRKSGTDLPYPVDQTQHPLANPPRWLNFKFHGTAIYLGGYCTHPDYSRRSRRLGAGSRVFAAGIVREKTRVLYVRELHALRDLLALKSNTNA